VPPQPTPTLTAADSLDVKWAVKLVVAKLRVAFKLLRMVIPEGAAAAYDYTYHTFFGKHIYRLRTPLTANDPD
jgi:hypothetical protein